MSPAAIENLDALLAEVRSCRVCANELPLGPRPVLQIGTSAKLLIIGQAPGARVHASGIPWDDASGKRLRDWLGIDPEDFYNPSRVAILPMGFCYPGRGAGGDLPPRRECAALWHERLLVQMPNVALTLLIGQYAQQHCLDTTWQGNLTKTVRAHVLHGPGIMALPHPSPRNRRWFAHNPWFETELLPVLRRRVAGLWPAV